MRDAEHGVGLQSDHCQQKYKREAGDQDIQRDFVGSLLTFRTLHQGDHAIQERLARIGCDFDADMVGQDLGAAGHRAAVAARFANYGGAFSGNHGLIHSRDAVNHFAVAWDQSARVTNHDVAGSQSGTCHQRDLPVAIHLFGQHICFAFAEAVRLRLPTCLRHGFGEVGEQHRKPEPKANLYRKSDAARAGENIADEKQRGERGPHFHDKHHRVF